MQIQSSFFNVQLNTSKVICNEINPEMFLTCDCRESSKCVFGSLLVKLLPPSNGSVKITKVGCLDTLVMFTTLVNLFVLEFNEGSS
jgi:hypothetical protein